MNNSLNSKNSRNRSSFRRSSKKNRNNCLKRSKRNNNYSSRSSRRSNGLIRKRSFCFHNKSERKSSSNWKRYRKRKSRRSYSRGNNCKISLNWRRNSCSRNRRKSSCWRNRKRSSRRTRSRNCIFKLLLKKLIIY